MPTRIWREDVQRLLRDEAAQLVEVLPPAEFEGEHIEGAINIPLNPNPPKDTDGRREESGRGVRELQGK